MFLTTKNMFDEIVGNIKLPAHTDYTLAGKEVDLYDTDFCVSGKVDYGGSEGIYLELIIEGYFGPDNEWRQKELGTIKTLDDSDEAYRDFCNLIADFVFGVRTYRQEHRDELIRKGYRIKRTDSKVTRYVYNESEALKFAKEGFEVFDCLAQKYLEQEE